MRCTLALLAGLALVTVACAAPREREGGPSVTEATGSSRPDPTAAELRVSTAGWSTDFSRHDVALDEIISGGPGKDGIPAIDEPQFEAVESVGWLEPQEPVIAVGVGGDWRAYPIQILVWHEIVNDTLADAPVTITFCPLCHTAIAFDRRVGDRVLDFGTTGNLRFSDLVMYDRQTESWWQQATGEAIVGVLTGTRLPFVPSQIVSLGDFATSQPEGIVLSRDTGHSREYGRNPYVGYDTVDQNPFLFRGVIDGRLSPMERVVTVSIAGEAVAYPYSEVAKMEVVHDEVGGTPIVVFWQAGVSSALDAPLIDEGRDIGATGVFSPLVGGRRLRFERAAVDGLIVDHETRSIWNILGLATGGPLANQRLGAVGHGDHFWFAWAAFEPETRIWTASE